MHGSSQAGQIKRPFVEEPVVEVVLLLKQLLQSVRYLDRDIMYSRIKLILTSGISTATSTTHRTSSGRRTPVLVAQLPTSVISRGGAQATVQATSSKGFGRPYGTLTPRTLFSSLRAAARGATGSRSASLRNVAWRRRRNASRGAMREALGRTLGRRVSI